MSVNGTLFLNEVVRLMAGLLSRGKESEKISLPIEIRLGLKGQIHTREGGGDSLQ